MASSQNPPRRPRGNWNLETPDGRRFWVSWGPYKPRPSMETKACILVPVPESEHDNLTPPGSWQEPQSELTTDDYLAIIDQLCWLLAPLLPTNVNGSTPTSLPSSLFWLQVDPRRIIEAIAHVPTTIAGPWDKNPWGHQWSRRHFSVQASQYRSFTFDYFEWTIVLRDRDDRHDPMPPRYYCYRNHHAVEGVGPFEDLADAQRACDADARQRGWLLVDQEPSLPKYPPPVPKTSV